MNITKNCGNCEHFTNTEGFKGKCIIMSGCIGENTNVYQWCNDFSPSTVTCLQRKAFADSLKSKGE